MICVICPSPASGPVTDYNASDLRRTAFGRPSPGSPVAGSSLSRISKAIEVRFWATFRTWRDIRLKAVMRTKPSHTSGSRLKLLKGSYGGSHRNSLSSKGSSPAHEPLGLRLPLGASSFSFSSASGIMRPNIELSIAVGIRPALLFSWPCAPDMRNCGTSG